MQHILLFGAGKSATVLIRYLLTEGLQADWRLTVVDTDYNLAQSKIGNAANGVAVSFDIRNETERAKYIAQSDIVISLLPPSLHFFVAADCLRFNKKLLTASYVDENLKSLQKSIEEKGLLFLCETGLDPGIDHMSAKKIIDETEADGGEITSFLSHCGGLVAPESDDNPWHYKISWNPRNVVTAGKSGAVFKRNGETVRLGYEQLFSEKRYVAIPGTDPSCWYPNRDSLAYLSLYGLPHCETFIRTTLRHPDFIYGWKNLIDLKLTDETETYETNGLSLQRFFQTHLHKHSFNEWLEQRIHGKLNATKKLLQDLMNLVELEEATAKKEEQKVEDFMLVNEKGSLEHVDLDELKANAAATVAYKMHEASLTLKQLFYLGMNDDKTLINKGRCGAADVLQFALEKKLSLQKGDKDMVVMLHEIEYRKENRLFKTTASLLVKGEDDERTAMAKTVGLPLGIAAKFILAGKIKATGLCIPVLKEIYEPVLAELKNHGIRFTEKTEAV